MNPRATPEILDDFYSQSAVYAYWNKTVYPASEELRREKIVKPRVKRILEICDKFKIPKKCLVEAGAGFGTFCDEVKKTGEFQRVVAIEPSATAKSCRQKGIETIEDFIENIKTLKFAPNVVASFEVIENKIAHCNGLVIYREYKGKGYGRQAMIQLLKKMVKYARVELVVHPDNNSALSLYLSLGFIIESRNENYFGNGQPRLVMVKKK